MQKSILGKTGMSVSVIGFGASSLGDVFGKVAPEDCTSATRHGIERGINFFDVSPYYGHTLAEQRLGDALSGHRSEVILATKCGRYGERDFDFSAATIVREFEASLRRLRTDYVDLLQAHDVEFGDVSQIVQETIPAMRHLQQQGKVRAVGITGYWPGHLAHIASKAPVDTVLNYCHANLLMNDMNHALTRHALDLGVGLLNASPLHMGLLGGAAPDWHPAAAAVRQAAAKIVALCRAEGISPATLALHRCLDEPGVDSTLVGLKTVGEVDLALAALTLVPPSHLVEQVRAIAAPVLNRTWTSGLLAADWVETEAYAS